MAAHSHRSRASRLDDDVNGLESAGYSEAKRVASIYVPSISISSSRQLVDEGSTSSTYTGRSDATAWRPVHDIYPPVLVHKAPGIDLRTDLNSAAAVAARPENMRHVDFRPHQEPEFRAPVEPTRNADQVPASLALPLLSAVGAWPAAGVSADDTTVAPLPSAARTSASTASTSRGKSHRPLRRDGVSPDVTSSGAVGGDAVNRVAAAASAAVKAVEGMQERQHAVLQLLVQAIHGLASSGSTTDVDAQNVRDSLVGTGSADSVASSRGLSSTRGAPIPRLPMDAVASFESHWRLSTGSITDADAAALSSSLDSTAALRPFVAVRGLGGLDGTATRAGHASDDAGFASATQAQFGIGTGGCVSEATATVDVGVEALHVPDAVSAAPMLPLGSAAQLQPRCASDVSISAVSVRKEPQPPMPAESSTSRRSSLLMEASTTRRSSLPLASAPQPASSAEAVLQPSAAAPAETAAAARAPSVPADPAAVASADATAAQIGTGRRLSLAGWGAIQLPPSASATASIHASAQPSAHASLQGSRAGSVANTRPASAAASRRGSIVSILQGGRVSVQPTDFAASAPAPAPAAARTDSAAAPSGVGGGAANGQPSTAFVSNQSAVLEQEPEAIRHATAAGNCADGEVRSDRAFVAASACDSGHLSDEGAHAGMLPHPTGQSAGSDSAAAGQEPSGASAAGSSFASVVPAKPEEGLTSSEKTRADAHKATAAALITSAAEGKDGDAIEELSGGAGAESAIVQDDRLSPRLRSLIEQEVAAALRRLSHSHNMPASSGQQPIAPPAAAAAPDAAAAAAAAQPPGPGAGVNAPSAAVLSALSAALFLTPEYRALAASTAEAAAAAAVAAATAAVASRSPASGAAAPATASTAIAGAPKPSARMPPRAPAPAAAPRTATSDRLRPFQGAPASGSGAAYLTSSSRGNSGAASVQSDAGANATTGDDRAADGAAESKSDDSPAGHVDDGVDAGDQAGEAHSSASTARQYRLVAAGSRREDDGLDTRRAAAEASRETGTRPSQDRHQQPQLPPRGASSSRTQQEQRAGSPSRSAIGLASTGRSDKSNRSSAAQLLRALEASPYAAPVRSPGRSRVKSGSNGSLSQTRRTETDILGNTSRSQRGRGREPAAAGAVFCGGASLSGTLRGGHQPHSHPNVAFGRSISPHRSPVGSPRRDNTHRQPRSARSPGPPLSPRVASIIDSWVAGRRAAYLTEEARSRIEAQRAHEQEQRERSRSRSRGFAAPAGSLHSSRSRSRSLQSTARSAVAEGRRSLGAGTRYPLPPRQPGRELAGDDSSFAQASAQSSALPSARQPKTPRSSMAAAEAASRVRASASQSTRLEAAAGPVPAARGTGAASSRRQPSPVRASGAATSALAPAASVPRASPRAETATSPRVHSRSAVDIGVETGADLLQRASPSSTAGPAPPGVSHPADSDEGHGTENAPVLEADDGFERASRLALSPKPSQAAPLLGAATSTTFSSPPGVPSRLLHSGAKTTRDIAHSMASAMSSANAGRNGGASSDAPNDGAGNVGGAACMPLAAAGGGMLLPAPYAAAVMRTLSSRPQYSLLGAQPPGLAHDHGQHVVAAGTDQEPGTSAVEAAVAAGPPTSEHVPLAVILSAQAAKRLSVSSAQTAATAPAEISAHATGADLSAARASALPGWQRELTVSLSPAASRRASVAPSSPTVSLRELSFPASPAASRQVSVKSVSAVGPLMAISPAASRRTSVGPLPMLPLALPLDGPEGAGAALSPASPLTGDHGTRLPRPSTLDATAAAAPARPDGSSTAGDTAVTTLTASSLQDGTQDVHRLGHAEELARTSEKAVPLAAVALGVAASDNDDSADARAGAEAEAEAEAEAAIGVQLSGRKASDEDDQSAALDSAAGDKDLAGDEGAVATGPMNSPVAASATRASDTSSPQKQSAAAKLTTPKAASSKTSGRQHASVSRSPSPRPTPTPRTRATEAPSPAAKPTPRASVAGSQGAGASLSSPLKSASKPAGWTAQSGAPSRGSSATPRQVAASPRQVTGSAAKSQSRVAGASIGTDTPSVAPAPGREVHHDALNSSQSIFAPFSVADVDDVSTTTGSGSGAGASRAMSGAKLGPQSARSAPLSPLARARLVTHSPNPRPVSRGRGRSTSRSASVVAAAAEVAAALLDTSSASLEPASQSVVHAGDCPVIRSGSQQLQAGSPSRLRGTASAAVGADASLLHSTSFAANVEADAAAVAARVGIPGFDAAAAASAHAAYRNFCGQGYASAPLLGVPAAQPSMQVAAGVMGDAAAETVSSGSAYNSRQRPLHVAQSLSALTPMTFQDMLSAATASRVPPVASASVLGRWLQLQEAQRLQSGDARVSGEGSPGSGSNTESLDGAPKAEPQTDDVRVVNGRAAAQDSPQRRASMDMDSASHYGTPLSTRRDALPSRTAGSALLSPASVRASFPLLQSEDELQLLAKVLSVASTGQLVGTPAKGHDGSAGDRNQSGASSARRGRRTGGTADAAASLPLSSALHERSQQLLASGVLVQSDTVRKGEYVTRATPGATASARRASGPSASIDADSAAETAANASATRAFASGDVSAVRKAFARFAAASGTDKASATVAPAAIAAPIRGYTVHVGRQAAAALRRLEQAAAAEAIREGRRPARPSPSPPPSALASHFVNRPDVIAARHGGERVPSAPPAGQPSATLAVAQAARPPVIDGGSTTEEHLAFAADAHAPASSAAASTAASTTQADSRAAPPVPVPDPRVVESVVRLLASQISQPQSTDRRRGHAVAGRSSRGAGSTGPASSSSANSSLNGSAAASTSAAGSSVASVRSGRGQSSARGTATLPARATRASAANTSPSSAAGSSAGVPRSRASPAAADSPVADTRAAALPMANASPSAQIASDPVSSVQAPVAAGMPAQGENAAFAPQWQQALVSQQAFSVDAGRQPSFTLSATSAGLDATMSRLASLSARGALRDASAGDTSRAIHGAMAGAQPHLAAFALPIVQSTVPAVLAGGAGAAGPSIGQRISAALRSIGAAGVQKAHPIQIAAESPPLTTESATSAASAAAAAVAAAIAGATSRAAAHRERLASGATGWMLKHASPGAPAAAASSGASSRSPAAGAGDDTSPNTAGSATSLSLSLSISSAESSMSTNAASAAAAAAGTAHGSHTGLGGSAFPFAIDDISKPALSVAASMAPAGGSAHRYGPHVMALREQAQAALALSKARGISTVIAGAAAGGGGAVVTSTTTSTPPSAAKASPSPATGLGSGAGLASRYQSPSSAGRPRRVSFDVQPTRVETSAARSGRSPAPAIAASTVAASVPVPVPAPVRATLSLHQLQRHQPVQVRDTSVSAPPAVAGSSPAAAPSAAGAGIVAGIGAGAGAGLSPTAAAWLQGISPQLQALAQRQPEPRSPQAVREVSSAASIGPSHDAVSAASSPESARRPSAAHPALTPSRQRALELAMAHSAAKAQGKSRGSVGPSRLMPAAMEAPVSLFASVSSGAGSGAGNGITSGAFALADESAIVNSSSSSASDSFTLATHQQLLLTSPAVAADSLAAARMDVAAGAGAGGGGTRIAPAAASSLAQQQRPFVLDGPRGSLDALFAAAAPQVPVPVAGNSSVAAAAPQRAPQQPSSTQPLHVAALPAMSISPEAARLRSVPLASAAAHAVGGGIASPADFDNNMSADADADADELAALMADNLQQQDHAPQQLLLPQPVGQPQARPIGASSHGPPGKPPLMPFDIAVPLPLPAAAPASVLPTGGWEADDEDDEEAEAEAEAEGTLHQHRVSETAATDAIRGALASLGRHESAASAPASGPTTTGAAVASATALDRALSELRHLRYRTEAIVGSSSSSSGAASGSSAAVAPNLRQ